MRVEIDDELLCWLDDNVATERISAEKIIEKTIMKMRSGDLDVDAIIKTPTTEIKPKLDVRQMPFVFEE